MNDCPFCQRIAAGQYDDRTLPNPAGPHGDIVTFEPLNPVTPGHRLVVPVDHVTDALESPTLTGWTMEYAAAIARNYGARSCNLITSVGAPATQTVQHLHIHVVPRRENDGLPLPWTPQQERERDITRDAEVLHAEHHPGTFVPSLDSCPEHDRADYERRVSEMNARTIAMPRPRPQEPPSELADRIRALHRSDNDGWCEADALSWPCPTVRLLGDQP